MHRSSLDQPSSPARASQGPRSRPTGTPSLHPIELESWLRERSERFGEAWSEELHSRGLGNGTRMNAVVDRFVRTLVGFLPWLLGPYRDQVKPLWVRASELFGTMAAKRGLAAGEVIEEFQVLRELVIRDLYRDPPLAGRVPLSLRDILRLNRAIDRGITHASVGHTDAMFFQFFEPEGKIRTLSAEEVAREVDAQLAVILDEMRVIAECARSSAASHGRI